MYVHLKNYCGDAAIIDGSYVIFSADMLVNCCCFSLKTWSSLSSRLLLQLARTGANISNMHGVWSDQLRADIDEHTYMLLATTCNVEIDGGHPLGPPLRSSFSSRKYCGSNAFQFEPFSIVHWNWISTSSSWQVGCARSTVLSQIGALHTSSCTYGHTVRHTTMQALVCRRGSRVRTSSWDLGERVGGGG